MPDNLPELRDIHLPDGVSIFPLAYGWWLILLTLLAIVSLYYIVRLLYIKSKKRYALRLLASASEQKSLNSAASMSEILRRICIYKYPQAIVLIGQQWVDFLNDHSKSKLDKKTAELLIEAPYLPEKSNRFSDEDMMSLYIFCRNWIGENL
ncbi:MAG: DUF4381 domain-containing protein [Alphaproteobacteria bacterium]|nr:DUF4381 domain-containing protein [Alphaproteobacteria bacterium]